MLDTRREELLGICDEAAVFYGPDMFRAQCRDLEQQQWCGNVTEFRDLFRPILELRQEFVEIVDTFPPPLQHQLCPPHENAQASEVDLLCDDLIIIFEESLECNVEGESAIAHAIHDIADTIVFLANVRLKLALGLPAYKG